MNKIIVYLHPLYQHVKNKVCHLWNNTQLYLHSFCQFVKNSVYHTLILITFIVTVLMSISFYTHHFINFITAITAILALFIWFGDLNRSWRGSLNNRLTVFYLAPKEELQYKEEQDDASKNKGSNNDEVLACYVRAHVVSDGDIRALTQQLASQLITQYIKSLTLKASKIHLKFDVGGTHIYHFPNPTHLDSDKGKAGFVNDIIAIVKLNSFSSDLKGEWCPIKDPINKAALSTSKLLTSSDQHFLLASIGSAASDEKLTTMRELGAEAKYAPFSHMIEHVKNTLNTDKGVSIPR